MKAVSFPRRDSALVGLLLLATASFLPAATVRYVNFNSTNPVPPYTSWDTAANVIQDAVDVAEAGDEVVVTNGVYSTGGRAVYGFMTNRVAIDKPIMLRSLNGPELTVIKGYQAPLTTNDFGTNQSVEVINANGAIRCVYLANGAILSGFTLTNGATRGHLGEPFNEQYGGGVWSESASALISNCILACNAAYHAGGGAYSGTLDNCTFTSNSCPNGGGAWGSTLNNCTLLGNSDNGVHGGTLSNCAVIGTRGPGAIFSTLNNCSLIGNLGNGAYGGTLNGCTLMSNSAFSGGGAYWATLTNCTLVGNSTHDGGAGAGVDISTLYNCTLARNSAFGGYGGAAHYSELNNCVITDNSAALGGGARGGWLNNCILRNNTAGQGGGAEVADLKNCLLIGNSASHQGGGAYYSSLYNCTLISNSAYFSGGAGDANLFNCIFYYNSAASIDGASYSGGTAHNCYTVEPYFVNLATGNFRLQSNSPCINAGADAYVTSTTDLDGRPRIVGGTVDIGAYEYQGLGMSELIGWLQQFGLPTDGSADFTDPDADLLNNWQEWRCDTVPTNALSVLRLLPPEPAGTNLLVRWQSVSNRLYFLERTSDLSSTPSFLSLGTNLPGNAGTTTFTDTNSPGEPPRFYRVGVQ